MHILVVALMILAGLHAGCAREVYYHPAYTPELWARDSSDCGRGAAEHGYFGKGAAGGWPIRDFYDRCLAGRGWTKTLESRSN